MIKVESNRKTLQSSTLKGTLRPNRLDLGSVERMIDIRSTF